MRKPRYTSLVNYLERTETTNLQLLARVKAKTGKTISPSLFSMILRGSRRCSLVNAWPLHIVTNVPMSELTRWPRYTESRNSVDVAQERHE